MFRCTRRPGKECSPSEGPCCDKTCQFITNFDQVKCKFSYSIFYSINNVWFRKNFGNNINFKFFFVGKSDGDCTEASYCNGKAAQCPEPDHNPDNVTECNQGTQVSIALLVILDQKSAQNIRNIRL